MVLLGRELPVCSKNLEFVVDIETGKKGWGPIILNAMLRGQKFWIKGQIVKGFGFLGYLVSVVNYSTLW